jgi:hypothetical protein
MVNGLTRLVFVLLAALASCEAGPADAEVARYMGAFYSAYVGRELTRGELRELTDQVVRFGVDAGQSPERIREHARAFGPSTKIMEGGGAAAETQRHWFLNENFFRPKLQGTIEQRLMTEGNPVRVTDRRSARVMTERDIVALANLRDFARSKGAPRHRDLSRAEIEAAAKKLDALVGGDRGRMPQFFAEASVFWIGVRQEWPKLTSEQRDLARAYAARTWRVRLPPEMYERLWGLPRDKVFGRQADDLSARLGEMTMINAQLGNLPNLMDAIFPP